MAVQRISPLDAQDHAETNPDMMLVCAYDTTEKFRKNVLDGAISIKEFQARVDLIPKNREIIFYCNCPNEATSSRWAEHYHSQGFRNVKVLQGGVDAWKEASQALTR